MELIMNYLVIILGIGIIALIQALAYFDVITLYRPLPEKCKYCGVDDCQRHSNE